MQDAEPVPAADQFRSDHGIEFFDVDVVLFEKLFEEVRLVLIGCLDQREWRSIGAFGNHRGIQEFLSFDVSPQVKRSSQLARLDSRRQYFGLSARLGSNVGITMSDIGFVGEVVAVGEIVRGSARLRGREGR